MSFYDLFKEELFIKTFDEVEEFTKRKLEKYNNHLGTIRLTSRKKEIFDAVWGNIEFSSGEIYILDSPLLQRLRNIRQLGLAYFVYCGSDYSRFYHTTGVVFLADRMAASLNRCDIGNDTEKSYFRSAVRLAAIFHDVGHMFFSHVSEHYFGKSPLYPQSETISNMLDEFLRRARKGVALHELLSCMMVNTTEVKRLLKYVGNNLEGINLCTDDDVDKLVEYISGLIVGVPVDRAILPYSSIINGPIDADKCDYLSRDSHVTRVPVAVDISRLTQKLSVVEAKDLNTSDLWHIESDTSRPAYELAMSDSAEKALFQLCIARTIMFDSVYYHHKVLTAETELRGLLNQLANMDNPIFTSFVEILEYTDDDFNKYFFKQLMMGRDDKDIDIIKRVQSEWEAILVRNMAKRIAYIIPEFLEGAQDAKEELFDNVLTIINSPQEKSLLDKTKKEYNKIIDLVGEDTSPLEDYNIFIVQSPTNVYGHSKIQVPIDLHNGNRRDFRGYDLVNSRETSSSASYVVTTAENRVLMYIAFEKVLYKENHVFLKPECCSCGKFDLEIERKYYAKLLEKGYFQEVPDLIPDYILYNYLPQKQINEIRDKFVTFDGPMGYLLSESEIKVFFKQILGICKEKRKCREVSKGVYKLLMTSKYMDRKFIVENVHNSLQLAKIIDNELIIVPLGGPLDSAKHLVYYFNDVRLQNQKIVPKDNLVQVLEEDSTKPIIFFDDGSYSGKQLLSIMQEYMGIPERATAEVHVESLSEELRERLKSRKIIYSFIAFKSSNESELRKDLRDLGLENVNFVYSIDMKQKVFEEQNIFDSDEQMKLTKDFLYEVGWEVMDSIKKIDDSYKAHWDEKRIKAAALGYNDAQQMVILKDSVPTYTITAFWQGGRYQNLDWRPLFRRTLKENS